jgi:hypothetical protein
MRNQDKLMNSEKNLKILDLKTIKLEIKKMMRKKKMLKSYFIKCSKRINLLE